MKIMMSFAVTVFMVFSVMVHADDKLGLVGGVLGGFSNINSGGTNVNGIGIGVRASYILNPTWQVGAEWNYLSTTPSPAPAVGYTSNFSAVLANIDYNLSGIISGLFVGAKAGIGFTSNGGTVGSSFAFGGEAGYDYFFGNLSVGPQINFIGITAPNITGASSGTELSAFAAVKYWL